MAGAIALRVVVFQPHREGGDSLMRKYSRAAIAVSLVAAAAAVLAACSSSGGGGKSTSAPGSGSPTSSAQATSGYNAAVDNIINPSSKTGGTLQLGATSDCDSWDPARTYYGWCWNMQRLFTRSLIGYSSLNGTTFKLAPDLATNMGTHNADFTQWTYTLKSGLKWSDGTPITPQDIKYGLERLFATDVINGGPSSYFLQGIAHPKNYAGPYKSGDLPATDIATTATSITINLTGPNADFDYLMAMCASAPVPNKTEGGPGFIGNTYTKHPKSSGPYMISSYTPGKSIDFVKNPYWSQSTDAIRHPLLNGVDLTIDTNPVDLDNQLKAGTLDANAAGGGLTAAFQTQALTQPDLKKNVDDPESASTQYLSVMQTVITNVSCRQAIFYASDKAGMLAAYGGPTAGTIAGAMTPPGIPGYDASLDPYPVGTDGTGDVAAAKAALVKCGKPSGFAVKMAYATPSSRAPKVFAAEKQALARVGITLTAVTQDASTYYSTFIGSPKNIINQGIGIALAGWGADFPTGVGFYQSIANGNAIVDPGNSNYPSLNDPVVNKILDDAPAGKVTDADWTKLNSQIMTDAVYLPIDWNKTLYYRNPRMTNVTCDNALAFGIYDFVNIGVS
jgi:peptide/nickel transport system substrate-binding protein